MTNQEREDLKRRIERALDTEFAPLVLATPDGKVRRLLTAFGDPWPGWMATLRMHGVPIADDANESAEAPR